jgi:hypothetical protein
MREQLPVRCVGKRPGNNQTNANLSRAWRIRQANKPYSHPTILYLCELNVSMKYATNTGAISLKTINFLLSAEGRQAAAALSAADLSEDATLARLAELRRQYPPMEAGALLALARLRRRAVAKFANANRLYFTEEALEQATAQTVAEHRARWIDRLTPPGVVLDLGCGIGGDTLALAQRRQVIAYEVDLLRLRLAQANAEAAGVASQVEFRHADWTAELAAGLLPAAAAAFADPARRAAGKRLFSLYAIQPPLAALLDLQRHTPALGVKVMPGVDDAEIPEQAAVEFVSHEGVCKEAVLWFGPLGVYRRCASVHTQGEWHTLIAGGETPPLGTLEPQMVLHEPDPAVIRAGAFAELCRRLDAHLFDPQIAYLVSPVAHTSPLVQSFRIWEIHPFALKQLNRRLHVLGIGQAELKKRGMPFAPETLRKGLRFVAGGRPAVVIFTRRGNERLMLIGERL